MVVEPFRPPTDETMITEPSLRSIICGTVKLISQLLANPGMAWRTICGNTMRRITCAGVMAKAAPASAWPRGTAKMAPRKVSVR